MDYTGETNRPEQAQQTAPAPIQQAPTSPRRYVLPVGIAVIGLFVATVAWAMGGQPQRFIAAGLQFAPVVILAVLAYAGLRNEVARVFTYIWLAILAVGVIVGILGLVLISVMRLEVLGATRAGPPITPQELFKPGAEQALLWSVVLLALATLVSAITLLRPVRVALSRIMPIDPDNFVHKVALAFLTLFTLSAFVPLIALGGRPPLLEMAEAIQSGALQQQAGQEMELSISPLDQIYQFVWTIPATFIAAGWPMVRGFRAGLVRLGMVVPTWVQAGIGVALGVVLAAVVSFALDPAIQWLWQTMGWPTTDVEVFERLMSQLLTPVGAVIIGVTAGIGEEMMVRGLLQPRLGIVASNLVFTAAHAPQYGTDALFSVFVLGLLLGLIRARTNTTTSAIVHGVYDFVVVMAMVMAPSQG
jgi:membrane protease YdiL (CAAX protease family)